VKFSSDQYISGMQGYFGGDESISHEKWTVVKTRKPHECMGVSHIGSDIPAMDVALRETAIEVDLGRVSCYVCLPCCDDWLEEIGETPADSGKEKG